MIMKKFAVACVVATGLIGAAFAQGLTEDIVFDIENNTGATMTALYLSTSDDPNWGYDIALDLLGPGELMEVEVADNLPDCVYDVRFEFSDGDVLEYGEVDFCALDGETIEISE
jgi:hypothetical protein